MFDKKYYDCIWGTIHRHDYCEDLAKRLIQKYGKVRILDIGTGCGYLVKILRTKGCDAWGLDISEYAIQNSCDPEHVRLGDIRDIPYASDFDVVHSQGVWEYIPQGDIQGAWQECQRVGRQQEHAIDFQNSQIGEANFVTAKSAEWWTNQFYPKVLVGCPNHEVKEYAFQEWIDCVMRLDYPNYEVLVVDNSPNLDFMNRWKDKVAMIHIDTIQGNDSTQINPRINQSMGVLRKKFLAEDFSYWFNLESDVIVPPNALKLLMNYSADWVTHAYPNRGGKGVEQGIGCSLFTREMMEKYTFENASMHTGADAYLWEQSMYETPTIELYNLMKVKHLGTGQGSI